MKNLILLISFFIFLAGCSNAENHEHEATDEVKGIQVDFELPEEAEAGEAVLLKTTVIYGDDELVTDAEEMTFEYWNVEDEENTKTMEATNNEDGTYTAEVIFDEPGIYEIYAHTTAEGMHTMPKHSITINGETHEHHEQASHEETADEEHEHSHGFEIKMNPLEEITINKKVDIIVELSMDHEPYENARVRLEIITENSEKHDWIEAEENQPGEYVNSYSFQEAGHAEVVVHVTDDSGLHEHEEFHLEVTE
ncbi:FixH family protein [Gracilibacillus sp. HCP3S3_G5_1]|uniref:FixH family protein n=1 Tax=unclassified Gracilibacillus TaxID=2625209 RepID=UPI003F8ABF5C